MRINLRVEIEAMSICSDLLVWRLKLRPVAWAMVLTLWSVCSNDVQAQSTEAEPAPVVTFLSHRTGTNLLYTMNGDGREIRPIFGGLIKDVPTVGEGVALYREPHWTRQSPNGKYFASWVYEKGRPYAKYQGESRAMLWAGDIAGTWTRVVNPDCTEEFAWAPDSERIAMSILSRDHSKGFFQSGKPRSTEVVIAGIDSSNVDYVLEQHGTWLTEDWSADGSRLLLTHREADAGLENERCDLLEFRVADAIRARNSADGGVSARGSEWTAKKAADYLVKVPGDLRGLRVNCARYSPDGKTIAVLAEDPMNLFAPNDVADDELGRERMKRLLGKLLVVDRSSGQVQKIADYKDGIRGPICWTGDGAAVLFSRYLAKDDDREKTLADKEHGLSIWSIDRDGKNARFITTGWSPDCGRDKPGHQ